MSRGGMLLKVNFIFHVTYGSVMRFVTYIGTMVVISKIFKLACALYFHF